MSRTIIGNVFGNFQILHNLLEIGIYIHLQIFRGLIFYIGYICIVVF